MKAPQWYQWKEPPAHYYNLSFHIADTNGGTVDVIVSTFLVSPMLTLVSLSLQQWYEVILSDMEVHATFEEHQNVDATRTRYQSKNEAKESEPQEVRHHFHLSFRLSFIVCRLWRYATCFGSHPPSLQNQETIPNPQINAPPESNRTYVFGYNLNSNYHTVGGLDNLSPPSYHSDSSLSSTDRSRSNISLSTSSSMSSSPRNSVRFASAMDMDTSSMSSSKRVKVTESSQTRTELLHIPILHSSQWPPVFKASLIRLKDIEVIRWITALIDRSSNKARSHSIWLRHCCFHQS